MVLQAGMHAATTLKQKGFGKKTIFLLVFDAAI
jgi:hypothetical protein